MHQIIRTHNAYHLGDNLVHLNFLRRVARNHPDVVFTHHAHWQYIPQLRDVIADIPNITLEDFNYLTPPHSIDSWRGANGFWYQHPNRNNFAEFHFEWFTHLAKRMGVENPVTTREDMLFDYPALDDADSQGQLFDTLIINSPPGSGQFLGMTNSHCATSPIPWQPQAMKWWSPICLLAGNGITQSNPPRTATAPSPRSADSASIVIPSSWSAPARVGRPLTFSTRSR
jgi:hypothetical protein